MRWYRLDSREERSLSLGEAAEELDGLLDTVCAEHMVSDVPVGVFLSGGMDSSAMLAHTQFGRSDALRAVSVGFRGLEGSRYNELAIAGEIARHLGSHLRPVELNEDVLAVLPSTLKAFDEPMADPSNLPVYLMMRTACAEGKVMITGDGGDEVFGGYNRYLRLLIRQRDSPRRRAPQSGEVPPVSISCAFCCVRIVFLAPDVHQNLSRSTAPSRGVASFMGRLGALPR